MANKKNSSTFEIDDFNIANVAIAANGGEKAIETVKKRLLARIQRQRQ